MAIRITKVYTRTGDKGFTKLVGGKKVAKDATRVEAYGTVDELNSTIGLARVFNDEFKDSLKASRDLDEIFRLLQNQLFDIGSELATPSDFSYEDMFHVGEAEVKGLERTIDQLQKDLEPLNSFILPGGGKVGGFLHQARTVCRRAERDILRLAREEELSPWPLTYVNRLSDLLFVMSRWVSKNLGEPEYLWERGLRGHDKTKRVKRKTAGTKRKT